MNRFKSALIATGVALVLYTGYRSSDLFARTDATVNESTWLSELISSVEDVSDGVFSIESKEEKPAGGFVHTEGKTYAWEMDSQELNQSDYTLSGPQGLDVLQSESSIENRGERDASQNFSLREFNNAIVGIAKSTNPTVVTVTTAQTVRYRSVDPFSMFFGDFGAQERSQVRRGLGSGVIIDPDGIIVTNAHVIEGADEIKVKLLDDTEFDAEVLGSDPMMDVAVLKVKSDKPLPSLKMGNSDALNVGELVLAIGSPLDESLAHSVSMGIVSAKGRSIGIYDNVQGYENFIQTDAAINPGNSGGALVNMDGQLVGINSAIASRSGGNQGIGFAIPINMARRAVDSIVKTGRVVRGFLGITWGGDVNPAVAKALNLDQNYGVIVGEVSKDGPADKAGLKPEDVLVTFEGEPIRDWSSLRTRIASTAPGEKVEIEYVRDGRKRALSVTLGELEPETTAAVTPETQQKLRERLGFDLEALSESIRNQLGLEAGVTGVVVTNIGQDSRAFRQGLRRGDVITEVQGQNVETVAEFFERIQSLQDSNEDAVLFKVNRRGQRLFIALEL